MHVLLLVYTQYLVPIPVGIMIAIVLFLCRSEEWNKVPKKERDKLGLKVEDDGEFWLVVHSHTVVWMGEWTGSLPKIVS